MDHAEPDLGRAMPGLGRAKPGLVCGVVGGPEVFRLVAPCQNGLAAPIETFSRKSRIGGMIMRRTWVLMSVK